VVYSSRYVEGFPYSFPSKKILHFRLLVISMLRACTCILVITPSVPVNKVYLMISKVKLNKLWPKL
jgi:hypothetical protein